MADDFQDLGGIETWLRAPNWLNSTDLGIAYNRALLQAIGTKDELLNLGGNRAPVTLDFFYTNKDKEEESELLKFFEDRVGRAKKFWIPGHRAEFLLSDPIILGDVSFKVVANFFEKCYHGKDRVYFKLANGDWITRKITAVSGPVAGKLTLSVSAFDRTFAVSDVLEIGFLYLVRFAKDYLETTYYTTTISTVQVEFQELLAEYP